MSEFNALKEEIHSMRGDFKELSSKLVELTQILIVKQEQDKQLNTRLEAAEAKLEKQGDRLRKVEDFITRVNPWITTLSKIALAAAILGTLIYLGLK